MTLFECYSRKDCVHLHEMMITFELLAGEDESLLIGRNAFLVLNFSLDSFDRVRGLYVKSDGLSREGLHENLHG